MTKTLIERVIEAQLQAVREMDPEVSTRLEDLDEEELRDEGIVVQAAIRAVLQEMLIRCEEPAHGTNTAFSLFNADVFIKQFAEKNGIEL